VDAVYKLMTKFNVVSDDHNIRSGCVEQQDV